GDNLGDEAERKRLVRRDPASAHDHVLRAAEPDQSREPLRAAASRDHPELHLRQRELHVVRGDTEVARERKLEPHAEDVAPQLGDDRLRAALGSGDVPREPRELLRRPLEERGDVAAGRERLSGAVDHDRADGVIGAELVENARELVARSHGHPVELAGDVERDRRHAVCDLHAEAVVLGHLAAPSVRNNRRRILPDGLFGSSSTKRYSRGRFHRAMPPSARQKASSSSAVVSGATTTATTRWPRRSSGAPTTATSTTLGCRATTSSTSSGCTFSPPEMIMSSTRPTSHRSPSSSTLPTSPVKYQPSRIAFSFASGRFQ